ncbi:MAG: helix-turn-helix transcriptional regulator [Prevotellaceae bacterium]|nr:helix-turn-helix transcriptional regulator [Candidatus Colivivens equi]
MKIHSKLFEECYNNIPPEQKLEGELSYGIAEKIYATLQEKGMSQKDFARQLGKRESEISKWLTGRHNFTLQTLALISTELGVNLITVG